MMDERNSNRDQEQGTGNTGAGSRQQEQQTGGGAFQQEGQQDRAGGDAEEMDPQAGRQQEQQTPEVPGYGSHGGQSEDPNGKRSSENDNR